MLCLQEGLGLSEQVRELLPRVWVAMLGPDPGGRHRPLGAAQGQILAMEAQGNSPSRPCSVFPTPLAPTPSL